MKTHTVLGGLFLLCFTYIVVRAEDTIVMERLYYNNYTLGFIDALGLSTFEPPLYKRGNKYSCIEEGIYKLRFERMATYKNKEVRLLLLDVNTSNHYDIKGTDGKLHSGIFIHEGDSWFSSIGCIVLVIAEDLKYYRIEDILCVDDMESSYKALDLLESHVLKGDFKRSGICVDFVLKIVRSDKVFDKSKVGVAWE
jgi:hypothetical protein